MRKIISSTEKPRAIKKNVQFSQEIDSKDGVRDGYRLVDDIEVRVADKIPIWLVGFLY